MKTIVRLLNLLAVACAVAAATTHAAPSRPNVIVVFIDDMGWGDFSCFGNKDADTPNIDRMAREGLAFEDFYVNSPICSPSRTAITTGQFPQRWRISSYLSNRKHNKQRGMAQWLDPKAPVLARILKNSGYATGHFGKWHMGGQRDVDDAPPITAYGFDTSLTNFEGMGPKLLPLTLKPGDKKAGRIWQDAERLGKGYRWMQRSMITGGFVDAALPFIDQAQKEGQPFYLNLWPDDVHTPLWPPVDDWADDKRGLYLAVLEAMDRQLERLFDRVRNDEALRDNTLIIVCSDNGPEVGCGSPGPFKGSKATLFEAGIRSPLVVWAPGLIPADKAGTRNRTSTFSAIDLVPSILAITQTPTPHDIQFDGEPLPDTLLGKSTASRQAPIPFRRPPDRSSFRHYKQLPDLAIRSGKWKLLCNYDGGNPRLHDLAKDRGEQTNLAAKEAERVKTLTAQVLRWHASMPPDNGPQMEDAGAK